MTVKIINADVMSALRHLPEDEQITWLRFVPHAEIIFCLAQGWAISDEFHGVCHGEHAVLMVWEGEGEPE